MSSFKSIAKKIIPKNVSGFIARHFHYYYNNAFIGAFFTIFCRKYKTEDCAFTYPKSLVTLGFRSRFFFDVYEKEERSLISRYVQPNDCVLELGGCIGVVSVLTNKKLSNKSAHVIVEANPELIPYLHRNREINQAGYIVEHCMVADARISDFYIHDMIVGGSANRVTGKKTQIVNRTIEELVKKHGKFNVLIMDIEGGELSVILSNLEQIREFRTLIIEFHDKIIGIDAVQSLKESIASLGFIKVESIGDTVTWER